MSTIIKNWVVIKINILSQYLSEKKDIWLAKKRLKDVQIGRSGTIPLEKVIKKQKQNDIIQSAKNYHE